MRLDTKKVRCVPKYEKMSGFIVQMQFVFTPTPKLQSIEGYITLNEIFINNIMSLLSGSFRSSEICNIETILKTNKKTELLKSSGKYLEPEDVLYIGVRLTVSSYRSVNTTDFISLLLAISGEAVTHPFSLKRLNVSLPSNMFEDTIFGLVDKYLYVQQVTTMPVSRPTSLSPIGGPQRRMTVTSTSSSASSWNTSPVEEPQTSPSPPQGQTTELETTSGATSTSTTPETTTTTPVGSTNVNLSEASVETSSSSPSSTSSPPQTHASNSTISPSSPPVSTTQKTTSISPPTTGTTSPSMPTTSLILQTSTTEIKRKSPLALPQPTSKKTQRVEVTTVNPYGSIVPFEDPIDGSMLLFLPPFSFYKCKGIKADYLQFCPKITLDKSEFKINWRDNTVTFYNISLPLDSSDIMVDANGQEMMICESKFREILTMVEEDMNSDRATSLPLFIVSVICVSLSSGCLFVTFLLYCLLPSLRTLPGLNNMAITLSLFITNITLLIACFVEIQPKWLCQTFGILIHFSLLSFIAWMKICTFHMTKVFVIFRHHTKTIQGRNSVFLRYCGIAALLPSTIVVVSIVVSLLRSGMNEIGYGISQPCYINRSDMIAFTVAIPLILVILSDFVMFIIVIYKVKTLPEIHSGTKNERNDLIIFAKLSTITGLTWIFAFLYQWTTIEVFSYLNVVFNGGQGVFIMFAFVCNKRVYTMIRENKFHTSTGTAAANIHTPEGNSSQHCTLADTTGDIVYQRQDTKL